MAFWEQGLEEIFHDDKAHSPSTWDFSQRTSDKYIPLIVEQVSKGNKGPSLRYRKIMLTEQRGTPPV